MNEQTDEQDATLGTEEAAPAVAVPAVEPEPPVSSSNNTLEQIVAQLNDQKTDGKEYPSVKMSARTLISIFGCQRRTSGNVSYINHRLSQHGLTTRPSYNWIGIDDQTGIWFEADLKKIDEERKKQQEENQEANAAVDQAADEVPKPEPIAFVDPVHRISRFLRSQTVVSIDRDSPVEKAMTLMLIHDFSQLPVMQGERNALGMVSWQSIGSRRFLNPDAKTVRECMAPCFEVSEEDSLFDAVKAISDHEVVLVRSNDNRIIGILTADDVSGTFQEISQAFLLISYIENHLRALIEQNFTVEELQEAKDPGDAEREIKSVSDMTFGEYERLLDHPDKWEKLGIPFEKKTFMEQIKAVRNIRNDVMHFDPEGIEDKDLETLKKVSNLLMLLVSEFVNQK